VVEKEINLWVEKFLTSLARFSRLRAERSWKNLSCEKMAFMIQVVRENVYRMVLFLLNETKKIARMIP
jgi:hypothetical protein